MKKLINSIDTVLTEALDGFVASHSDLVSLGEEHKFIRRKTLKQGKVALISGGGAGHEPLHAGFVGHGNGVAPAGCGVTQPSACIAS